MKTISRRDFLKCSAAAGVLIPASQVLSGVAYAKTLAPVELAKPATAGANPALGLLEKRSSAREFSPQPLPVAVLSRLLWAAFGINRKDGKRTAPSARNKQEMDIYVAAPEGAYLYEPKGNMLKPIIEGDIRGLTGIQPYVKNAAVNLVYVADTAKMDKGPVDQVALWMGADSGVIAENVYIFCAGEGLVTVLRALIDKPALAAALKLRPEQTITFSQSVGYPKKA